MEGSQYQDIRELTGHHYVIHCVIYPRRPSSQEYTYMIARTNIQSFNRLRPRQNGRHFADDIFKRIFLNENVRILVKISLKFVPKGPINNIPALVQIIAWHRSGDKPLSEPMMFSLPTHICVTRPQWVNPVTSRGLFYKGSLPKFSKTNHH